MYGDAQSKLTTFMMAINDAKALYAKQNITIKYTVLDSQGHYGLAARAVQTAATNAFPGHVNGESAHVVLGSDDSVKAITDSVSASVVDYNLVNVAWGTDDAAFSHGSVYPNSERVYPSMSYESAALADFLHYQYRVSRVVLIHTINTYGQDAVDVFHWRASNYGIQVIATIGLAPGGLATNATRAQLVSDVQAIAKLDARIFVILSDEVPAVQTFWRTAAYLLSQNTFFLGSSGCAQPALWQNVDDLGWSFMNVILGGFIGIQHATDDWKISPIGGAFVSRFNAMKPTVRYSRTTGQVTWCDPSVDDAGRMIYNRTLATGGTVCLGNKPSAYTVYNVSSYAGYLYDAVMLAVQGVVYYQQTQQPAGTQLKFPAYMDGSAVAASYALQNVTFQGLTGHVRIEPGIGGIPDYGWGDRVTGTRYKVVNYQINATQGFAGFKFSRVGTWTHHDMFVPCTSDPLYLANPTIYGNCTPISWATPFNVIPPDRADPVVQYMPQSIRGYLTFIVVASWLATAAVVAVLLFYGFVRKSRLLKASQPIMMLLMMMSMLWGCIRVSLATATLPTQPVCVTRFWFGHLAFTIVPTLLAKTLRVHLVVNAKMRKVKIKTSAVVAFTSALIAVMVVLMVLLTPLNKEDVYFDDYTAVTGQVTHKYFCESRDFKVDFILYAYEMLLLVVCLKLCYDIRDVPDAVNESLVIFKVMFTYMAVGGAIFAVLLAMTIDHFSEEVVLASAYFICIFATYYFYFWPKMSLLLQGADLDKNFQIVFPKKEDKDKPKTDKESSTATTHSYASVVMKSTVLNNMGRRQSVGGALNNLGRRRGSASIDPNTGTNLLEEIKKNHLKGMPKTLEECKVLLDALHAHNMMLTQRATGSSRSRSMSNKSRASSFHGGDDGDESSRGLLVGADNSMSLSSKPVAAPPRFSFTSLTNRPAVAPTNATHEPLEHVDEGEGKS